MVRAAHGEAGGGGGIRDLPAMVLNPLNHQESTSRGQAGILMDVHLGLQLAVGRLATTSFASQPQMNNLYSFHS
jgi:hypothetical protein